MSRWLPARHRPARPPSAHEVTLVVRAGCHLCETAEQDLVALAAQWGFVLRTRDLDTDAVGDPQVDDATRARWADLVPVVLVDGREHGYWRVEPDRLRVAVGARR